MRSFELLDVIETTDGNVWKGVVVEQTSNVSYKIALAGGSIDTNYLYSYALDESATGVGLGMNLSTGLQVAVSPLVGVEIGGDYHPATDTISDTSEDSVSCFALRLGATVML